MSSAVHLGEMFARDDFNSYPVEEDGQMAGIVTKFDMLKCFAFTPSQMVPHYADLMNRTVADVMMPEFIYVRPDTKLTRVLQLMVEHRIRSVPVLDGDNRLGFRTRYFPNRLSASRANPSSARPGGFLAGARSFPRHRTAE